MKEVQTKRAIKAFSYGAKVDRFAIDGDDVLVFDAVAGHYTRCHSLTTAQIKRIKRIKCA